MDVLAALLSLLEEKLLHHDRSREEVQRELHEVSLNGDKEADSLEERINADIHSAFDKEEEVLSVIEKRVETASIKLTEAGDQSERTAVRDPAV